MPTTLAIRAFDESTYVVNCSFKDEDAAPVIPNVITWTLTNDAGTVINGRTGVVIAVPAASVDILLSGDDLDYADGPARILVIDGTYDSPLGTDLPIRESVRFLIEDLVGPSALTFKDQMASDLSAFFNVNEFAELVTYAGTVITAIVEHQQDQQMTPERTVKLAALFVKVGNVPIPAYRDPVIIDGDTWHVIQVPGEDQEGVWKLGIEKESRPLL